MLTDITPNGDYRNYLRQQAVRGFAILLCIVPAVGLSLSTVPLPQLKAAVACLI